MNSITVLGWSPTENAIQEILLGYHNDSQVVNVVHYCISFCFQVCFPLSLVRHLQETEKTQSLKLIAFPLSELIYLPHSKFCRAMLRVESECAPVHFLTPIGNPTLI